MKSYLYVAIFLISVQCAVGRIFSRCELAQELRRQGFNDLPNWVCLVESESSSNTAAVGGPNSDGSYDWGLFQINDRYWCNRGSPGAECNISCESLLTDDITDDSICTRKIFSIHGFGGWYGWVNKCQGQQLPDLSSCGV